LPLAIARLARQKWFTGSARCALGQRPERDLARLVRSGAKLLPIPARSSIEAPESVQGSVTLRLCEQWVGRRACPQGAEESLAARLERVQHRKTVRTPIQMSGNPIEGFRRELADKQVHKLSAAQTAGRSHGTGSAGSRRLFVEQVAKGLP
jgi:hypothetical protein